MSEQLNLANAVRKIIVKAWTDSKFKNALLDESMQVDGNARKVLRDYEMDIPTYGGYDPYPVIKVYECVTGKTTHIVLPPAPKDSYDDLGLVAARANTVLGI